jgi:hypothetical protein
MEQTSNHVQLWTPASVYYGMISHEGSINGIYLFRRGAIFGSVSVQGGFPPIDIITQPPRNNKFSQFHNSDICYCCNEITFLLFYILCFWCHIIIQETLIHATLFSSNEKAVDIDRFCTMKPVIVLLTRDGETENSVWKDSKSISPSSLIAWITDTLCKIDILQHPC